jgi:16S rRNA (adenine1518-N6/adenine1519-N6)-dimethyltransferase
MSLLTLPPLRTALASAGLHADKRFGQHFLLDLNICRKIVRLAELLPGERVLEVGPGPGGLTRALLEAGAEVIAVEKDARFLPLLDELAHAAEGRLTIVHGDALAVDEVAIAGEQASIVANLPYNVGSPLLIKWLTGTLRPRAMTLMFQKEVALRIAAAPPSGDHGRLSVISQAICETRIVMDLPARAFTPPPKVDSAVIRLTPRAARPSDERLKALQAVTHLAFGQRRKMLRSAIRPIGGAALCERVGIDPEARAETLTVAEFLALADATLEPHSLKSSGCDTSVA